MHPDGKQTVEWLLKAGGVGEENGPWEWGGRQERRLWKREGQMGMGSAGRGSVKSSDERVHGWTDTDGWGCWRERGEGSGWTETGENG